MKLLIVEDDPSLVRFLRRAFTAEGYVMDVCQTGVEAVALVEMVPYALVVMDWMLPVQDGLTTCRELRARGYRMPILILTARPDPNGNVVALDAGADDYLSKPFHLDELMARVRSLLRRAGEPVDQLIRVGRISIDFRRHAVLVDEQEVRLRAQEFLLLSLLMRNVGRVVSRAEIVQQIWSTNAEPDSNMIGVITRHLREKLGAAADHLETVRGQGLRLMAPARRC